MAQEELTSEAVTIQAVDWLSTVLSIPLIWPKTTVVVSLVTTVLGLFFVVVQLTRPAVPPPPPLDQRRVAAIQDQVRQAEATFRAQLNAQSRSEPAELRDYSEAVFDPKHEEKHHDPSRIHAH